MGHILLLLASPFRRSSRRGRKKGGEGDARADRGGGRTLFGFSLDCAEEGFYEEGCLFWHF